jgi:hypothetical protein
MGNKASSTQTTFSGSAASIVVAFDQAAHTPGQLITGRVSLKTNQNLACNTIKAKIVGVQHTHITYRERHKATDLGCLSCMVWGGCCCCFCDLCDSCCLCLDCCLAVECCYLSALVCDACKTRSVDAISNANFVDFQFSLGEFPGDTIPPGSYEVPFSFKLPADVPPTMSHRHRRLPRYCFIDYRLEVWLDKYVTVKHSLPFTVVDEVPPAAALVMEPSMQPVTSMSCIKKGEVYLGYVLSSAVIVAGKPFTIKYAFQTRPPVVIRAIEVSVVETTFFQAQQQKETETKVILFARLTPDTANFNMGRTNDQELLEQGEHRAVASSQKQGQGQGYSHPSSNPPAGSADDSAIMENLYSILSGEDHKLNAVVSVDAKSTFLQGTLIKVTHQFIIKVITANGQSNPVFSCPVTVKAASSREVVNHGSQVPSTAPVPTADSAPQVAACVELPPLAVAVAVDYEQSQQDNPAYDQNDHLYPSPSAPSMALEIHR